MSEGGLKRGPKVLGYMLDLKGANEFAAGMSKAGAAARATRGDVRATAADVSRSTELMSSASKRLAGVVAPLVTGVALKKAWDAGLEQSEQFERVGTRLALGARAADVFGDRIDALALRVGIADDVIIEAGGSALQMQVRQADVADLLEVSARNAASTFQDVGAEVAGTMTIVNNFGEDVRNAEKIQGALWVGVRRGAESVGALTEALEGASAGAAALGIGYEELIALNALLNKAGMRGTRGLMAIQNLLLRVTDASDDALTEASRLEIEWDAAGLRARGFAGWIEHVATQLAKAERAGNNTAQSLRLLGISGRQLGVFSAITKNAAEYRDVLAEIRDGSDELEQRWANRKNSVGLQAKQLEVAQGQMWESAGLGLLAGMTGVKFDGGGEEFKEALEELHSAGKTLGEAGRALLELAASKPMGESGPSGLEMFLGGSALAWGLPKLLKMARWAGGLLGPWASQMWNGIPGMSVAVPGSFPEVATASGAIPGLGTMLGKAAAARVIPTALTVGSAAAGFAGATLYSRDAIGAELSPAERFGLYQSAVERGKAVATSEARGFFAELYQAAIDAAQDDALRERLRWEMTYAGAWLAQTASNALTEATFKALREAEYDIQDALAGQSNADKQQSVHVKVDLDHTIRDVGPKAKERGHRASAKVAGAGDGQGSMYANYRFFERREGDGIYAVQPLPQFVRSAYTRPGE